MPMPPLRFDPGDTAYARPCTTDRKVTLLKPLNHTSPQGIHCPHWEVRDAAGDTFMISQLELSSRPTALHKTGAYKLLQGAAK